MATWHMNIYKRENLKPYAVVSFVHITYRVHNFCEPFNILYNNLLLNNVLKDINNDNNDSVHK